jgi:predicted CopG family antitoxin
MAVKTITIDMDAYEALRRRKRHGQSFSDVIKEHFTRGTTGAALRIAVLELRMDESTLDAVDDIIGARAGDVPRGEPL